MFMCVRTLVPAEVFNILEGLPTIERRAIWLEWRNQGGDFLGDSNQVWGSFLLRQIEDFGLDPQSNGKPWRRGG